MTLYRQLMLFTLAILICLFSCFWWVQLNSTRNFLQNQLQSNAQDTATSLGLSLSTVIQRDGGDVEMETMVNAIFERGYFQAITIKEIDGKIRLERETSSSITGVPCWFTGLFPIESPSAEALIMSGWSQAGSVEVKSHPGYGYTNLWQSAKRAALWAAAFFTLVAFLGGAGLKLLLRSLDKVERQAIDLSNRNYHIQKKIPRTRELRRVVLAMNMMTSKVKTMFDEQTAVAEGLRQHSYQDSLTGLGNRRFFEGQLKTALLDQGKNAKGFFLLLHVEKLQELNEQQGYKAGDDLICNVALLISKVMESFPDALCGRLSGSDFGIFLTDSSRKGAEKFAEELQTNMQQLQAYKEELTERVSSLGGVIFTGAVTFEEILSKGDEALRSSSHSRALVPHIINISEGEQEPVLPRTRIREIFEYSLAEKQIALKYRMAMSNNEKRECLQYEILSQFFDEDGNDFSAGLFVPVAEQLGMMPELDRLVIEKVLEVPPRFFNDKRVTINLSAASIADENFVIWLEKQLQQNSSGLTFNFEIPEFLVTAHLEQIAAFATRFSKMGHGIGVDHFGQGLVRFGYLQTLNPDYVKIDRALTHELKGKEGDVYFFIRSLCAVAHGLDIKVMADGVETKEQLNLLAELNIDGVQGYYIDKPTLLKIN